MARRTKDDPIEVPYRTMEQGRFVLSCPGCHGSWRLDILGDYECKTCEKWYRVVGQKPGADDASKRQSE
jgi:hypothetical protein